MNSEPSVAPRLQREVMVFSFGWMLAANLVGVLLALLLVFPGLGNLLGPLTYGRWMPLHMEWHLYGWCSLPLVGLLLKEFVTGGKDALADVRFALAAWSLGLLVGGLGYLGGHASGKLFLSWSGLSRMFFPISIYLVWSVLATNWTRRRTGNQYRRILQGLVLAGLAFIPIVMFLSSSRSVYPPVNPESGGATGHSLLASTLGLMGIFAMVPLILGRASKSRRLLLVFWAAYALLWTVYLLIHHGNASNLELNQIFGLGSLVLIVPVFVAYIHSWEWPTGANAWVVAFMAWWALLTLNGWFTFLPGWLDHLKFTNALVAHAHLAMAGMATAFSFIILASLGESKGRGESILGGRRSFWLWNLACLLMVLVLFLQGWREGVDESVLFGRNLLTGLVYWVRLLCGLGMATASVGWLALSWKREIEA